MIMIGNAEVVHNIPLILCIEQKVNLTMVYDIRNLLFDRFYHPINNV